METNKKKSISYTILLVFICGALYIAWKHKFKVWGWVGMAFLGSIIGSLVAHIVFPDIDGLE